MGKSGQMFASVKSYGQRGKLLSRSEFQTLAEARDIDELVMRIKNTPYAPALSDLPKPHTAAGIEIALGAHLADAHHSMAKVSGNREILDAYYRRLVTWNLKIVLKGKALGKSQDEIERHLNMRAAELVGERDALVSALVAKDLDEAVAGLRASRLGEDIARAAALYAERGNVQAIDTYFDRATCAMLARAARGARGRDVIKMISMDVDFYNLLSVLRGKLWGLDEQGILDLTVSQTPSAPRSLLERMAAAATVRDALAELSSTGYARLVSQSDSDLDAVSSFERAFELEIYTACNRAFTRMFSFATVIGITKLVAYEVRNIASIAYAVEQRIPVETTMSKLIAVQDQAARA